MTQITKYSVFLALASALTLGVSAGEKKPAIITFDVPGAGTSAAPCLLQGTFPYQINSEGMIGGNFQDASNVLHSFVRAADGAFVAFDAPSAWAGAGSCQGTQGFTINSEGAVAGKTIDGNYVQHGMLRDRHGMITVFDVHGAGTALGQGSLATNINSDGVVAGLYLDANNVVHSFVRAPDGTITTIDVPAAGTGAFQGTSICAVDCLNAEGLITGTYLDTSNVPHGFLRDRDGAITTFDVPGAGTGAFQGTGAEGINSKGEIVGVWTDPNNANHGFLRAPVGTFTTFDVPGAGIGSIQGTLVSGFAGINPKGAITGSYVDANNLNHGFLRASDGTITTLDVPGAGTGAFQGTSPLGINVDGAITGYYIDASNLGHGFVRIPDRDKD